MRRNGLVKLGAFLVIAAGSLSADLVRAITIPTVEIGSPANPADARTFDTEHPSGLGAVGRAFNMGKTEVTNAEYVAFLNAVAAYDSHGLFDTAMASDSLGGIVRSGSPGSYTYAVKPPALSGAYAYDDKPVVWVSLGDAMRFANWLHNGQPTGPQDFRTTEDGAYWINDATNSSGLAAVSRNAAARWWVPSESEWYKAAYYDPVTQLYYDFPTGTNNGPNNKPPASDTGNSTNFYDTAYTTGNASYPLTNAGAYALTHSPFGTFDQGGNVREWTDSTVFDSLHRSMRGGGWNESSFFQFRYAWRANYADVEFNYLGFRVASSVALPGDFNNDGNVDAADYVSWRKAGLSAAEYDVWRAQFSQSPSARAASNVAIPEPPSLVLFITIIALASIAVLPRQHQHVVHARALHQKVTVWEASPTPMSRNSTFWQLR